MPKTFETSETQLSQNLLSIHKQISGSVVKYVQYATNFSHPHITILVKDIITIHLDYCSSVTGPLT